MAVKTTRRGETRTAGHAIPGLDQETLHQRIAERAYFRFLDRGQVHGYDWEDWFQAEQEVLSEVKAKLKAEASTIPGKRKAQPQPGRKRSASSGPGTL